MAVVMIYGFTGSFVGPTEIDWLHPALGVAHKCMLFLRQPEDAANYPAARTELSRFGLGGVDFTRCGKLQVEVLNTDTFRGFAGFYEDALANGSCVVYYPNEAVAS